MCALVALLLLGRALRPRKGLEAAGGNRLAGLDREAVGAGREPLLGALDRRELLTKLLGQRLVDLLRLDDLGVVGGVARRLDLLQITLAVALQVGERLVDPLTFAREQLARAGFVHRLAVRHAAILTKVRARRLAYDPRVPEPVVIPPGEGHRLGNVEFLARTTDTPRFNFSIIQIAPGRELESHVHDGEDDAFYILEGELTFVLADREVAAPPGTFVLIPPGVEHGFRNDGEAAVRMLNIHAPAGFDRRIGLAD